MSPNDSSVSFPGMWVCSMGFWDVDVPWYRAVLCPWTETENAFLFKVGTKFKNACHGERANKSTTTLFRRVLKLVLCR